MQAVAETLMFLPGAGGNMGLWRPVAERIRHPGRRRFFGWPGFGGVPPEPDVAGLGDLVARVTREITGPVDLFAQSMGGVIAVRAALEKPMLVRHLVLSVTSGGIDMDSYGAVDWRPSFRANHPNLPRWFLDERSDLSARLREVEAPVLLLWGDADPISPVAVGRRLADLFPQAELVVVKGGTHDLAFERADELVPHIERHLARAAGRAAGVSHGDHTMNKVNLTEKLGLIAEHWRPKVVGELNGQEVKLVKFQGTFVWHQHENEDELFLGVSGRFRVEFRDRVIELGPGELIVVPRGVEHRTVADEEAAVLIFEPAATRNTGNVEHTSLTAPTGVRI